MRKSQKTYRAEKRHKEDPYAKVSAFIAKGREKDLKRLSMERGLPVSRLIAIAIDNEFEGLHPFQFDTDLPVDFQEFMYAKEGGRLLEFLSRFDGGMSRDQLLLLRHDLGIPTKDAMLGAIAELLDKEMIVENPPTRSTFGFYKSSYRVLTLKDNVRKHYQETAKTDES